MEKFFEYLPQIIEAAAKSYLAFSALIILLVAFIGLIFFRKASFRVRLTVFFYVSLFSLVLVFIALAQNTSDVLSSGIPGDLSDHLPSPPRNDKSLFGNPLKQTYEINNPTDLVSAYKDDKITAELRYNGNFVQVTGPYPGISRCEEDTAYCIKMPGFLYGGIVFYFPSTQNEQIVKLAQEVQNGQDITVLGQVERAEYQEHPSYGPIAIVLVKDCKIVGIPSQPFQP
jgi:tRNA_anti-like